MVVLTEVFENLARVAAEARGFDRLRQLVLPHPLETRKAAEIREIARTKFGQIVDLLTRAA